MISIIVPVIEITKLMPNSKNNIQIYSSAGYLILNSPFVYTNILFVGITLCINKEITPDKRIDAAIIMINTP